MPASTTPARFLRTVSRVPDRTFLVAAYSRGLDRLSYAETARRAWSFARCLQVHGVEQGDRVVLCCRNSLEYVCAYFGTWLAGATAVPLDPRSHASHAHHVYRDCRARCMVVSSPVPELEPDVPQLRLAEVDWNAADGRVTRNAPHNDLALIVYTSGTTGVPKGVCLTHANLEATRAAITTWAQVTGDDRELTTLSLTHLFGLAHLHVYAAVGGTVYIEDGFRDVPRVLALIRSEGITSFPGTPAGFRIVLDQFAEAFRQNARGLRYIVINTAPMPVEYTQRLLGLLPETRVYMYYGLTEASRSAYLAYRHHPDKLASVGRASPGAQVCVGRPAAPLVGEPGEILVKGPHVTSGYWDLDSTAFFDDGWFRTGDLGVMDDEGFLTWLGRVREQINVNGLKLTPAEVEAVLCRDPRVKECAVVAAPDPLTGEAVVAFVVPAVTPDGDFELHLRRACRQQLEMYKVPKRILCVDALPRTDSGKVKRFVLQERVSSLEYTAH